MKNIFNQKNINTVNILTFIQVLMQTRNINTFSVLTFIQIRTDENKFMLLKNGPTQGINIF